MTPILCSIEGMTGIPTMSGCASTIERYRKVPIRSDFTILSRVVIWLVLSRIEGLLYRWSLNYICQWKAVLHWQLQYPERACKEFGAIHCVFPAGNAVVAATEVEEIVDAQWRDLGMPETLWHCRVKEFGPLIVSIDTEGRNLFEENKVIFNQRKDKAVEEICKHVSFIK